MPELLSIGWILACLVCLAITVTFRRVKKPRVVEVNNVSDFPAPVAGVITLKDDVVYNLRGTVDLSGAQLVVENATFNYIGGSTNPRYILEHARSVEGADASALLPDVADVLEEALDRIEELEEDASDG